jgi:hypothetical protein
MAKIGAGAAVMRMADLPSDAAIYIWTVRAEDSAAWLPQSRDSEICGSFRLIIFRPTPGRRDSGNTLLRQFRKAVAEEKLFYLMPTQTAGVQILMADDLKEIGNHNFFNCWHTP